MNHSDSRPYRAVSFDYQMFSIAPNMIRSVFRQRCVTSVAQKSVLRKCGPRYLSTSVPVTPPTLSKIVATIGPASEQYPELSAVVEAGMRIMRINFSHATYDEADLRKKNLSNSPGMTSQNNMRAIMLDTQGPEIRTGSFGTDGKIELTTDTKVTMTNDETYRFDQTPDMLWCSYPQLCTTVSQGSTILLDDGAIELRVDATDEASNQVTCTVMNSGQLGSRKGVNLPNSKVLLPAMSDKDKEDIRWGIKNDVDYIAVSFVRKAEDLTQIKEYCSALMKEFSLSGPLPALISKIESTEAMENFDEILGETDGVMVARGDLGVEIPMETLAHAQKEIVRKCNEAGKPVVVATQMLESMQKNPRPTRAECTDVANAIYDGADCVMLSGESAKGKYPTESVQIMSKIIDNAELYGENFDTSSMPIPDFEDPFESVAIGAVETSKSLDIECIVVIAENAAIATKVSKFRPDVPVYTMVNSSKQGRMLQMYRCIHPVLMDGKNMNADAAISDAIKELMLRDLVSSGDDVVVVSIEKETDVTTPGLSMRVVSIK